MNETIINVTQPIIQETIKSCFFDKWSYTSWLCTLSNKAIMYPTIIAVLIIIAILFFLKMFFSN